MRKKEHENHLAYNKIYLCYCGTDLMLRSFALVHEHQNHPMIYSSAANVVPHVYGKFIPYTRKKSVSSGVKLYLANRK